LRAKTGDLDGADGGLRPRSGGRVLGRRRPLPHAALAEVDCPIRAWWGERDAVLSSLLSPDELERDLASRGVEYNVMPGLDHTGMLDRLDLILPTIASWLADQSSREPRPTGR